MSTVNPEHSDFVIKLLELTIDGIVQWERLGDSAFRLGLGNSQWIVLNDNTSAMMTLYDDRLPGIKPQTLEAGDRNKVLLNEVKSQFEPVRTADIKEAISALNQLGQ